MYFSNREIELVELRRTKKTRLRYAVLEAWLIRNHLNKKALAEKLGVKQCSLSNWIHRKGPLSKMFACRILGITQLSWDQLFYEEREPRKL